jgi:ferredoxin--NADP+ reductase
VDRPGSSSSPLRVAVVGSGPAGFYAAAHLLGAAGLTVELDMFDRLPTPWGLVRAGVAPDHPKIKSVSRVFEKTASRPGFRFFGNVEVGRDVTHEELLAHHHAVLYASGSPNDQRLGIPGEDLLGSHAATDFVAWYNGHPDYCDLTFDLSCRCAVVVGNGNVALDVARMLALTREELEATDTADDALEALAISGIEEIVVLGRRGPAQAAYTSPELRELDDLAGADVVVDPADAVLDPVSRALVDAPGADPGVKRNVEIVAGYAAQAPRGRGRVIRLRFLASPVEILGHDRVEGVRIVRNELAPDASGVLRAVATDRCETIEAGLVFRSVGYRGAPLPGLPFDERRGVISNTDGRVIDPQTGEPVRGVYVAGWIKRGPTGVIGTNKKCAQDTVDLLLEDLEAGVLDRNVEGGAALDRLVAERQPNAVDYAGWEAIDRHERAAGEPLGRPRVKVTRREELIRIARAG